MSKPCGAPACVLSGLGPRYSLVTSRTNDRQRLGLPYTLDAWARMRRADRRLAGNYRLHLRLTPILALGGLQAPCSEGSGVQVSTLRFEDDCVVSSFNTWVAVEGRRLAVRVHLPCEGLVRGILVIVPPAGRERINFHRSTVVAGVAAARAGLMVWTPCLTGEGDSSSAEGLEDLADVWEADVSAVVDAAVRGGEGLPLSLVGIRLGAAVAGRVEHPSIAERMAWDPVSGRHYVRAQLAIRALTLAGGGFSPPEDTEFIGSALSAGQLDSLRGLRLPPKGRFRLIEADSDADRNADTHPQLGRIAWAGGAAVVAAAVIGSPRPISWVPQVSALIPRNSIPPVQETFVQVGPHRLTGILTEPVHRPTDGRAVLFTATGSELREGPASLWAGLARRLAADGVVSLRCDRRLIGDSVDPGVDTAPNPYTDDAVADVCAAIDYLRRRDNDVVVVGLCAGAWLALRAAAKADVSHTIAINTLIWADSAAQASAAFERSLTWSRTGTALRTPASDSPSKGRPRKSARHALVSARAAISRRRWVRPTLLAARYGGLGVRALFGAARRGRVTLLHGREEDTVFRILGGRTAASQLQSVVEVIHRPGLEHSLFTEWSRAAVTDIVEQCLNERRGQCSRPSVQGLR